MQRDLNLIKIGTIYCDPERKVRIPELQLQIWPGYKTAVNLLEVSQHS